jgi:hypothetical protein
VCRNDQNKIQSESDKTQVFNYYLNGVKSIEHNFPHWIVK